MEIRKGTLEDMGVNRKFWQGKKVFITGHTGFKGSWLALWLSKLGAQVHGYALAPITSPNIFHLADIEAYLESSTIADIRDSSALSQALRVSNAEIVFHLAAQPLVRYSYLHPVETFGVNVMGTVNLLEAVRQVGTVHSVVNITTDKCYENKEWAWPYREDEPLGGHDPYSSSKACSELVTAAYRSSFLAQSKVAVATARAGNVIGGGDWSPDRLIPDFLRASEMSQMLSIRSPNAIRPWQHVLEPLAGYLQLAEYLSIDAHRYAQAWNFGPADEDARNVAWIADYLKRALPGTAWEHELTHQPHEAHFLKVDSSKARQELGWKPKWHLPQALDQVVSWHLAWKNKENLRDVSIQQIDEYETSETSET